MVEKNHVTGWWPSLYEPFAAARDRLADWFSPVSEASTDGAAYKILVELPGVAEKDVAVTLHDGVLRIKGEKRSEKEEKGKSYYFSERSYGSFQRSFRLPEDADEAAIDAEISDGVLTVTVPRAKSPEPKARSISVKKA